MRFSNITWKISPALLVMASLILIAGAAAGQDFFNEAEQINPDDKYKGTEGGVVAWFDDYFSGVEVECADLVIDYEIGCATWHPDKVNVSKNTGQVDQKKKDNNAIAWFAADLLGGVPGDFDSPLLCEKVQMKGKYNKKTDKMDLKCTLKKCDLPGWLLVSDVEDAIACGEAAVDAGHIGKRAGNLKIKDGKLSGHIRSKGPALIP
jgi:hypothetical protein